MKLFKRNDGKYSLDLTSLQESIIGKLLHHLLYNNQALYSLAPNAVGCPHNGGSHSFMCVGKKEDIVTFVELLDETYREKFPEAMLEIRKLMEI